MGLKLIVRQSVPKEWKSSLFQPYIKALTYHLAASRIYRRILCTSYRRQGSTRFLQYMMETLESPVQRYLVIYLSCSLRPLACCRWFSLRWRITVPHCHLLVFLILGRGSIRLACLSSHLRPIKRQAITPVWQVSSVLIEWSTYQAKEGLSSPQKQL
jgi:hypothetical protein